MFTFRYLRKQVLWILGLGLLINQPVVAACSGVFDKGGTLNVMTLNLLFSEYDHRAQRLKRVADFIAKNNIHIVALQEVVGGELDAILAFLLDGDRVDGDTAKELRKILQKTHGLSYELRRGFSNGAPGLRVYNAILSRCTIVGAWLKTLPKAPEVEIRGLKVELGRSVLAAQAQLQGYGRVNVFNTHLCSNCTTNQRLGQADVALKFVNDVHARFPSKQLVVLGDFNTNVPASAGQVLPALYKLFTQKNGLIDSYASTVQTKVYCVPGQMELGCTHGVSDVRDPFNPSPGKKRIDYIFGKGPLTVKSSKVFFNPLAKGGGAAPGVSDHSALVTRYGVP